MSRSLLPLAALLVVGLACGCARYHPQSVSVQAAAGTLATVPAGPLAFEAAVRLLVARNPRLCAARSDIAAVNLNPGPRPLAGSTQILDGNVTETMIGTDILSLLGLGPRAAERALARALRNERILRHHELARDLVGELAEAYAVEHVLRQLAAPAFSLDVDAFESAGLASRSTLAAARSVRAEGEAEARVIRARLEDVRREIARLVGAAPGEPIQPVEVADAWPTVAEPDRRRLVLARGDLLRLYASWCVADRTYRHEVSRQIPNVFLGLGGSVDLQIPMQLIRVELPLDAPARARAAEHARAAAYHRLQAGVLDALHDARSAQLGEEAARASLQGAEERRRAASALFEAQAALLETDPQALSSAVLIAGQEVDAARQHREAAVAAARAHVRTARAAGWPTPAVLGGAR